MSAVVLAGCEIKWHQRLLSAACMSFSLSESHDQNTQNITWKIEITLRRKYNSEVITLIQGNK